MGAGSTPGPRAELPNQFWLRKATLIRRGHSIEFPAGPRVAAAEGGVGFAVTIRRKLSMGQQSRHSNHGKVTVTSSDTRGSGISTSFPARFPSLNSATTMRYG